MDNHVTLLNEHPFVKFYKDDVELPLPKVVPTGKVNDVAWSNDGKYLVLAHDVYPFMTVYRNFGEKFNRMPNPMISVGTNSTCCVFSPCDTYLVMGHEKAPFLSFYKHKRNENTIARLTNPFFMPKSTVRSITYSNDGRYLTITQDIEPTTFTYEITGETYIKLDQQQQ